MDAKEKAVVGVFPGSQDAEHAVRELQLAGFDMRKVSVIGKDYQTEQHVLGYYNTGDNRGDRASAWGKSGLFWGWIWGLLLGSGFFVVPGLGPIMVGGPILSLLIGALEAAVVTGGLTALGGALASAGIPRDSILRYETAINAHKFVLIVQGNAGDTDRARSILAHFKAEEALVHPGDVAPNGAAHSF